MKKLIIVVGSVLLLWGLLHRAWFASTVTTFPRTGPDAHEQHPSFSDPTVHGFPEGTTNILAASASVGMGGRARLVRFHAPLSNILAYVQGKLDSTDRSIPPLGPVSPEKPRLQPYGLHELDWFDVENISTGLVVQGVEYNSMIYVDAQRELYYYMRTD